jgi:hypothetical protein
MHRKINVDKPDYIHNSFSACNLLYLLTAASLAYSSNLKIEVVYSSETSVNFSKLCNILSQKIVLLVVTEMKTSNLMRWMRWILWCHLCLGLPSEIFHSSFPTKIMFQFLIFSYMLPAQLLSTLIWSLQWYSVRINYKAPHFVIFCVLTLLLLPYVQIFSAAFCFQMPSDYTYFS